MNRLVPGKLYKFQCFTAGAWFDERLNGKLVMYLGEDHINRADGIVIKNFRAHVIGNDRPGVFDDGLRHYLKDVD